MESALHTHHSCHSFLFRILHQNSEAKIKMEVGAKGIEYKKSEKFDAEIATKFDGAEAWLGLRKS